MTDRWLGITEDRWKHLMAGNDNLTEDELRLGWHWCHEFDGLLVGPGMGEQAFCTCFDDWNETGPNNEGR